MGDVCGVYAHHASGYCHRESLQLSLVVSPKLNRHASQGIAVRTSFNLSGTSTILSIGILDSISAGILLYAGIAQLLVGDWLAGEMRTASAGRVAVGGVSLFLGLFAMSVIGKWA